MALPATKRRKLEHSGSEDESEGSFSGFGETDGVELDNSDAEQDLAGGSDVSMSGAEELDDDQDLQDEEEESSDGDESFHENEKPAPAAKVRNGTKPPKRPATSLQDGVYTAETFKSNVFKLQADELLEQVKLKYGKKEAPAENAMRTLKSIIEQIPSRDALPVRIANLAVVAYTNRK